MSTIDETTKKHLDGLDWKNLSVYTDSLADQITEADKRVKELKGIQKYILEGLVPDKLDNDGFSNITIDMPDGSKRRWQTSAQAQCSILKEHRSKMYQWLEDNGHGSLITDTVNSSTFKAFVLEQKKKGNKIPEEYLSLHLFSKASLVKA